MIERLIDRKIKYYKKILDEKGTPYSNPLGKPKKQLSFRKLNTVYEDPDDEDMEELDGESSMIFDAGI
jgi:hypothetical protein